MYCTRCGTRIGADAVFCPSCGAPLQSEPGPRDADAPVLTARPVFVPLKVCLQLLPLQLFFTVWGGGFFGGFSMVGLRALGIDVPTPTTFVAFALLFFAGIPLVGLTLIRRTYARTVYTFYGTRLEYHEGFFAVEKKTIDYRNVTEVSYRQGVLQKRHGLATIVLSTAGLTIVSGRARSGIRIVDVPDGERIYAQVRALVERAGAQAA